MKLTGLACDQTLVSDLAPLKGMPLVDLNCSNTGVSDLSPLKDIKLTWLHCQGTKATDLSPLQGMPLKVLYWDFDPKRDAEILSSIKTLEKINDRLAAQFLPNRASDGSDLVGTWTADHFGLTDEMRIARADGGAWGVRGRFLKAGKEVGSYVGVQPQFEDGVLAYRFKLLVKPGPNWQDEDIEVWKEKDRLDEFWPGYFASFARAAK